MSTVLEAKALDRISRRVQTSLEEDLRALNSMAPETIGELRSIFHEATKNALTNILDEPTARTLIYHIRGAGLVSQHDVMAYLDSLLRDGSAILKAAILEEFRATVHDRVLLVQTRFDETMNASHARVLAHD